MTRRVARLAAALLLVALPALASADAAQVRRLLNLLRGIEQEYLEAFDDAGAVVRSIELEEAALLLDELRDRAQQLGDEGPSDLDTQMAALADAVAARAPVAAVSARTVAIGAALRDATGVSEEVFPAAPPSAARGEILYRENCAACHGVGGAGDGPDAAALKHRPPDFTDAAFMRAETPLDFFLVISLGRRRAEMPAWESVLAVQERWDLVSYVWSLRPALRHSAGGQPLFITHCARCHAAGAAGPGTVGAPAAPFTALERMAARSDAELYTAIVAGVAATEMPAFGAVLGEDERWTLVVLVRALSLGVDSATDVPGAAGDPFDRVARGVAAAVDAYRLQEKDAADRAANAYLRFEPLEPGIARRDAAAVGRVEAEFVRFQKALRQPDAMREVEAAAAAVTRALDVARRTQRAPSPDMGSIWTPLWIVGAVAACVVLVAAARRRRAGAPGM